MRTTGRLSHKQLQFLNEYAKTNHIKNAAMSVGYTARSAPQMGLRTLRNPLAQEYLQTLRTNSQAISGYDVATAMAEALDVIHFAKEHRNANAYCKAVELRAKLSGLLIDRVEVFSADLKGALLAASKRVIEAAPGTYSVVSVPEDEHAAQ